MTIEHILMSADEELQNIFVEFAFAEQIREHQEETCECDIPEECTCEDDSEECECNTDGWGTCYFGRWCDYNISSSEVIADYMDNEYMEGKFRLFSIHFPEPAKMMIYQAKSGRPRIADLHQRPTWEEYVASVNAIMNAVNSSQ